MDIDVRNLAQFKRFLALPGATVQVVRHDNFDDTMKVMQYSPEVMAEKRALMFSARQVLKLQENSVQFTGGSWLTFGKRHMWRFEGATAIVRIDPIRAESLSGRGVIVYQLSITKAEEAA